VTRVCMFPNGELLHGDLLIRARNSCPSEPIALVGS
jgi:hypothetical protein